MPPFPVDDTTLGLLEAAMDPWSHGDPDATQSSVYPLLEFLSQMGGSDTKAVAEVVDDGGDGGASIVVMRDPQYTSTCVMAALIAEIRRLRADPPLAQAALPDQIRHAVKGLLAERGLAQYRLAARVGITPKHLSEMLNAHSHISVEMAERIFAALGHRPMLRVVPLPGGDA